ncbi:hypothetical protein ACTOB_003446 [Actinoplanes oblitus]|uniref:Ig-like domain-containing protein n=1 Tax=Actinoplanes oblitus TaxID=3040509 RepID=A0ABY8WQR5_9ACTN|nr:hypothetical protein [Actinoplanes oblitus]WIM99782.1 hypothetical protein ACTOB_003446 [Actinoplanes oblitus]
MRRRWFIAVLCAMVVLAVIAGIALSRMRHPRDSAAPRVSVSATAGSEPDVTASPEPDVTATHRPRSVPTHHVTAAPIVTATTDGPAIAYFRVTGKPSCPSGTNQAPHPGDPVTLEWKVTGADKTTLSVDGPGVYAEYRAKDSATLTFSCGGDPGAYQTHTYLLTAITPDGTRTKKLTVQAKINEITTV